MEIGLANKFLIIGLLLYAIAGIMFMAKMRFNIIAAIASMPFLAIGFFMHIKHRWLNLSKNETKGN
jgi:hypothetical protein